MPKRKRDDADEGDRTVASVKHTELSRQRASEKILHGKKVLHRALKLAKGFERQKLSRRQKIATKASQDADLKRIDDEILALKNLDLVLAAEAHLHKTLNKEKAIATSPALPEEVKAPPRPQNAKASVNVAARLYNANPVKEAMAEVLPLIRSALGVREVVTKLKAKGGAKVNAKESSSTMQKRKEMQRKEEQDISGSEDERDSSEEEESQTERDAPGVAADDDDDFLAFDARVAGSSEDEDDLNGDAAEDARPFRERTFSPSIDGDLEPSPSVASDMGSPPPEPETKVKTKEKKETKRPDTSFLPSLTMGGYWSGSESGAEDMGDVDIAPRKNRRGQRARQQIAEKKFGNNAKHLQNGKQAAGKGGRDDGWDMKRGAKDGGGGRTGGAYRPAWAKAKDVKGDTGENATALGGKREKAKADADKPLHPSWEAARKAKEAKKIDITTAFTGKKVVF